MSTVLKRLQSESIDLVYLHAPDHGTDIEETMRVMNALHRSVLPIVYGTVRLFWWIPSWFGIQKKALDPYQQLCCWAPMLMVVSIVRLAVSSEKIGGRYAQLIYVVKFYNKKTIEFWTHFVSNCTVGRALTRGWACLTTRHGMLPAASRSVWSVRDARTRNWGCHTTHPGRWPAASISIWNWKKHHGPTV